MSELVVRNLGVAYGDLQAVWDVSLSVSSGRITVLVGRNGSGKSTSMLALAGLLKATGGSVELDGVDITNADVHRRVAAGISLVAENRRIFRERTVGQNLRLGGWWCRRSRQRLIELEQRSLELFPDLRDRRSTPAGALSGGQQQMVAIAQALMADPKILLLDEPSAGLAPIVVDQMLGSVTALARAGLAVVLVEQQLDKSLPLADRVVIVDQGRTIHDGSAGEIDETALRHVYLDGAAGLHPSTTSVPHRDLRPPQTPNTATIGGPR